MWHRSKCARALCVALSLALMFPLASHGQQPAPAVPKPAETQSAQSRDLIAVLDLEPIAVEKSQSIAVSDRLREELFKSGKFTLVERAQLDAVLNEQALQQTGCTSTECAVKVGKVLGVRKIVSGRVNRVGETQWLLTVSVTDVETAETVKTASVAYEGPFFSLLDQGVTQLAVKLTGAPTKSSIEEIVKAAPPPPTVAAVPAPPPPPAAPPPEEKESSSLWWWVAGGVVVAGAAAAASSGGSHKSGGGSGSPPTSTLHFSW